MNETIPSVTKDPSVRIRSTWRDPIGRPLTGAKIVEYALEGRYGDAAKRAFMPPKPRECCRCGGNATKFVRSLCDYLKAGWYCKRCKEIARADFEKQQELDRRANALLREQRKAESEFAERRKAFVNKMAEAYE